MQQFRAVLRPVNDGLLTRFQWRHMARTLSTNMTPGNDTADYQRTNSFESTDDFEQRIFGGTSGNSPKSTAFFQKLDQLEKARDRYDSSSRMNKGFSSSFMEDLDDGYDDTLSDGMDGKLMNEATYFEFDPKEVEQDDYSFRPDVNFIDGSTYETKDLDLTKPAPQKVFKRLEFEVTTAEVLRKADFRNVRFLANFMTEAGIIIKRSQTRISAKAQRKVAREIKTARAFGLMPFTTMGTKHFVFGKTMENLEGDFAYDAYDDHMSADVDGPPRV